jgi:hypothetical protein
MRVPQNLTAQPRAATVHVAFIMRRSGATSLRPGSWCFQ